MADKWPGVGDRIEQRLQALGYWKNDKADVMRFSMERRYVHTYVYKWLDGTTTPDRDNLFRLAKDLEVHPAWLLFGDEIGPLLKRAGRRVLAALAGLALLPALWGGHSDAYANSRETKDEIPLIRRRSWKLLYSFGLAPSGLPRLVTGALQVAR